MKKEYSDLVCANFPLTKILFIVTGLIIYNPLQAQEKLSMNGYLTEMIQYQWYKINNPMLDFDDDMTQNIIHNRLNFSYFLSENITFSAQFRNQFQSGDFVALQNKQSGFKTEQYLLPLTYYEMLGNRGQISLSADRLNFQFTHNNIDIIIGRQRINWGQTFAWNPNDIFNSYNYFDFDYPERPGADAVRIQYYTGLTSQIDIAAKLDSADNPTIAALYRFNNWGFDFQFIGGYYSFANNNLADDKEKDYVFGIGTTSDIKGLSVRSEGSYFHPADNWADTTGIFLASLGLDYTFNNSLFVGGEFLYISNPTNTLGANINSLYSSTSSVKTLSFAKHNLFAQSSYPITPLLNASIAGMVFFDTDITGYYAGPTIDYSIAQNVDVSLIFQYFNFSYEILNENIDINSVSGFMRMKWSF